MASQGKVLRFPNVNTMPDIPCQVLDILFTSGLLDGYEIPILPSLP